MKLLPMVLILPFLLPQEQGRWCGMEKQEDAWWCTTDEFLLETRQLEKGKCWKCEKKPVKVRVCAKTYYGCKACPEKRLKPTECCVGKMLKKVMKARIIYQCIGTCSKKSHSKKSCDDKVCDSKGRSYKPRCLKSGVFPHGKGTN